MENGFRDALLWCLVVFMLGVDTWMTLLRW